MRRDLWLSSVLIGCIFYACEEQSQRQKTVSQPAEPPPQTYAVPEFSADSAYAYVAKQVSFGPRVPNTESHKACGNWLQKTLGAFTDTLYVQQAVVTAHDGKRLQISNIIGSFNPAQKKRILLFAHWDTRPFADEDDQNRDKPIDGANDGGSGVGIWLEVARQLKLNPLPLGIDIMFVDAEDYGQPTVADSYCLGAQYWAKNPHIPNYHASFGILLDMVGAKDARFFMEGYSMNYAPSVVRKVWDAAARNGYSEYFVFKEVLGVTDDHYYINQLAGIPSIDIIQRDLSTPSNFAPYWHTLDDNMDIIDKATLKAVGQTLLVVIYAEAGSL